MCGIAGIVQSASVFNLDHAKQMADALSHRGPDGTTTWQDNDGTVLFGHRRLSIIDLSTAAGQPMHLEDRYTIVYNGEIYNFIELKKELQNEGYRFHTQSDTEVILAAYAHWEEDCVEHFDGMFAFAIWDSKEKELFAARDRFGEKPFFYHLGPQTFSFASEMKALWAIGIPRKPNLKMLFNFITIGYTDNPSQPDETFFENIVKLPPASRMYFSPQNMELTIERYWDIDTDEQDKTITQDDAIEKFTMLLTGSVKRRLRSDVSIGTSLSGGLDSSTITALIDSLKGNQTSQQCFTATFPNFERDELKHARAVAERFKLQQHIVPVTAEDLVANWNEFVNAQEEPVASASAFAQYKVFQSASENNITVLLDGQGADETLAGYTKYYKWYWQELFQKRKLISSGEIRAARALGVTEKFGVKNIMASLFPDLASVILERQYLVHALSMEDLNPEFVKLQSKEAYYTTPEIRNLNGLLYFNTCTHGLEELLRYADRNSMAHGREVRLPFLSHELVSFIFSLPASFKIKDGWTKSILRKSVAELLPKEITWRRDKVGFEPPQETWMQHPEIQVMIREAKMRLVEEGVLKEDVLNQAVRPTTSFAADAYDWRYLSAAACL